MTPNSTATRPLLGITRATFILGALLFTLCSPSLRAQVGDNNPTGVSGIFNGQAGGCGYDPYTGNATRAITDISVAGSVGDYPLALVRTANSRTPSTTEVFSYAGGWNHNYNWIMEDSEKRTTQPFQPSSYTVDFPDGRVETFKSATWDPGYYRVKLGGGAGSAGVRERVAPITPPGNMYAFLILPDGGKVKFSATLNSLNGQWFYKYQAVAIIDPHGLETTLAWENYGNGKKRLTRVTEPAGRYLQFSYTPNQNNQRISQVQEFINGVGGRIVQYNYPAGYLWLGSVVYYGNANWTARYQYVAANVGGEEMPPLLWTCDDPMYPGPMHKIAYTYRTADNYTGNHAVYGQISSENYFNGTTVVSTLTVPSATTRVETRGDGKTRTFTYTTDGYLTSCTDFMTPSHTASQGYDGYKYINYVSDRNGNRTDFTNDPITGNVTQVQFPLTPGDTPGQGGTRPTVNYTYTNNYYLHTIQGENSQTTTITRDPGNNRVTRADYSDGGYETFSYDAAHFYQLSTHRITTGGTETFAYDTTHRLQYYSDPYHSNPGNPSIQYSYEGHDWVSGIIDVAGNPTNWTYNDRGQVLMTTLPSDPGDGIRHTIINAYNNTGNNAGDGTLVSVTDQLGHMTSYTYDDYRRLKSVTPPLRGYGDNSQHITHFYYDVNGVADDYRFTDSKVTWVVLPSGKKTKALYDDNRRRNSVTMGYGTADAATTSYGYDSVGNLTAVSHPLNHSNVNAAYDERNRPSSVSVGAETATFTYDTLGRKKSIARSNGQVITSDTFDPMNRVTQQTATQTAILNAVTKYSYYTTADGPNAPVGLLKTMQDPRLVAIWSTDKYTYTYDMMGRKIQVQYPLDSYNVHRTEQWSYDTVGRLQTFTNRNGNIQTFGYDTLNRMTGFTWNDGGITPSVSFGYDVASRPTSINNANANITKAYYDDNLIRSETEQILLSGGTSKTVSYAYDADGNRAGMTYPDNSYSFTYGYTGRNQLSSIGGVATYGYDLNGNMTSRDVMLRGSGSFTYDTMDRVNHIAYSFLISGDGYGDDPRPSPTPQPPPDWQSRTFDYDYDSVGNRKWMKREDNSGDVFGYDLNDQVIACWLDIVDPVNTPPGDPSIVYDGSGNRTVFGAYQSLDAYTTNNLNQYTLRNVSGQETIRPTPTPRGRPTPAPRPTPVPTPSPTPTGSPTPGQLQTATYDYNGNMTTGFDGSLYGYDAQNRLLTANKAGAILSFQYDGLNRQVSRTAPAPPDGPSTGPIFSVWDGWDLIEEYQSGNSVMARYLYGPDGVLKNLTSGNYYYRDGSGSTSYVADGNGNLLEFYLYDLQGTPKFYDGYGNALWDSTLGVRHLFTGQQWYSDIGLYDLRNRFYSPDIGRFLQPDPIGFRGDRTNLYRYCRNNPVTRSDPAGLQTVEIRVDVTGKQVPESPNTFWREPLGFGGPGGGPGGGGGGPGGDGFRGRLVFDGFSREFNWPSRNNNSNTQQQPPPQNPPLPNPLSSAPAAGVFSLWGQLLVPQSAGVVGSVAAEAGWGEGMTASYSAAFGDFGSDNGAPNYSSFQSYGGFWGGPSGAWRMVDSNQTNFVLGGAVGPSGGVWFSNATSASNVMGPFSSYFANTPWGNASFSLSNNGYYVITLTFPGSGLSVTGYTTNTEPLGGW